MNLKSSPFLQRADNNSKCPSEALLSIRNEPVWQTLIWSAATFQIETFSVVNIIIIIIALSCASIKLTSNESMDTQSVQSHTQRRLMCSHAVCWSPAANKFLSGEKELLVRCLFERLKSVVQCRSKGVQAAPVSSLLGYRWFGSPCCDVSGVDFTDQGHGRLMGRFRCLFVD